MENVNDSIEALNNKEKELPHLPADFFLKLSDLPKCKTEGICDNCGRCEH